MGGVKKTNPNQGNQAAISIAISFSQGLNGPGGLPQAQAFAGPNGAFAQAGPGGPGGLGSLCGCGTNHNMGAFANNFGGPQGPQNPQQAAFQQGFQQGQMAAKMKRLMRKLHRLMSQMGGGPQGFGGPQSFGTPFGGPQPMPFRGLV